MAMKKLKIPVEYWDLNTTELKIVCPKNMLYPVDMGHLETVFKLKYKLILCSMQTAKRDKNGRTFNTIPVRNLKLHNLIIDIDGSVEEIIKISKDGYVSEPITVPAGYNYDPAKKLIWSPRQKKAIFFVFKNGIWERTYRKMPDHPFWKPPTEIPKVGCPESKKRKYTKLTDTVKKEKAEKKKKDIKEVAEETIEKEYKKSWILKIIEIILKILRR